jgi:hypothetical protein
MLKIPYIGRHIGWYNMISDLRSEYCRIGMHVGFWIRDVVRDSSDKDIW